MKVKLSGDATKTTYDFLDPAIVPGPHYSLTTINALTFQLNVYCLTIRQEGPSAPFLEVNSSLLCLRGLLQEAGRSRALTLPPQCNEHYHPRTTIRGHLDDLLHHDLAHGHTQGLHLRGMGPTATAKGEETVAAHPGVGVQVAEIGDRTGSAVTRAVPAEMVDESRVPRLS